MQSEVGRDVASLDVHYLGDGSVVGTLVILCDSVSAEDEIKAVLQYFDESLLPMASLDEKNLSFTVLRGHLVGQYEHEK